jgi:hypothetical protein
VTPEKLTPAQAASLSHMETALLQATQSGLLDILMSHVKSADSINDVCDGVTSLVCCSEIGEPSYKKYLVELSTLAMMRGSLRIRATTPAEAKRLALYNSGNVQWKYEGACEGAHGPQITDLRED